MKTSFIKLNLISLGCLFLILSVALSACNTDNCIDCRRPPHIVGRLFIYGKVHNISTKNSNHKWAIEFVHGMKVLFIPHRYPCSDSTGSSDAIKGQSDLRSIQKPGKYAKAISLTLSPPRYSPCFTASVIAVDTTRKKPITNHYYHILAGPKKVGVNFDSFHGQPLHDSVRVDFTLPDSTDK